MTSSDMQTQSFMDIQWLSAFGVNKLSALDYFYTSPFFDNASNNQRIRVQGVEVERRDEILKSMTGLEYMLDDALTCEPNIYVIRKQIRKGPMAVDLVDIYYIADGVVFQSPEFLAIVKSRLSKASFFLTNAFDIVKGTVKYSHGKKGFRRTDGSFQCWNEKDKIAEEGGEEVQQPTISSGGGTKKRKLDKQSVMILKDFPSFKSIILDTSEPVFTSSV